MFTRNTTKGSEHAWRHLTANLYCPTYPAIGVESLKLKKTLVMYFEG